MRQLEGKRVLITGAARGIGLALARRFAAEGSHVLLTDVDAGELQRAVTALEDAGHRATGFPLDVTDEAAVDGLPAQVCAAVGPIDVLVNNAGVVFGGALTEVPMARHRATFEINVLGLIQVTRAFLPDLIAREQAHVVNVASASGFIPLPFGSTYAASKWAVIGFSESLRRELPMLGHRHVGVTTACPSYVATGLFDGATPPRTTRMLTPERLADRIVSAVRRRRAYILTPWIVKVTPVIRGALPLWLSDRISDLFGATDSMKQWRGHS